MTTTKSTAVICYECSIGEHDNCQVDLNDDDPKGEGPVPCECKHGTQSRIRSALAQKGGG